MAHTNDPHLQMAEIPLPSPLPDAIDEAAHVAVNLILGDILHDRVRFLVVLTFRGSTARLWRLMGTPAADDVARALAERDGAEAIAFVHPMPVPTEVDAERCMRVAFESAAGRRDVVVATRIRDGKPQFSLYAKNHDDYEYQWLGVPAIAEIDVWEEGPVGLMGPLGEA